MKARMTKAWGWVKFWAGVAFIPALLAASFLSGPCPNCPDPDASGPIPFNATPLPDYIVYPFPGTLVGAILGGLAPFVVLWALLWVICYFSSRRETRRQAERETLLTLQHENRGGSV